MFKKTILLATRNKDKFRELKDILSQMQCEIKGLDDIDPDGKIPHIKETGKTLLDNALIKAKTIYNVTGIPTIADDTGLEVDALGGKPGVYSARYAGKNCTYNDNVRKLLSELLDVNPDHKSARFRTVACFFDGEKELWTEGAVEGMISDSPMGDKGFGYDPIFYVPEMKKTFAQMTEKQKNAISHRGNAIRKLLDLMSMEWIPTENKTSEIQEIGD
ncbi:MAG: RdgB/HAM1 family non-canonical purine NTP pyrophosphatase [Candidatus Marinimicrobia bacterium]|nr:RdgB/HAM1 family non-canonical purine NTP pyrophosphatase [Candidatus Neomarinimicrobiota bacterium]MBL7046275.1 RdgB/HAM1 family non-canonical purine NTP pyrophosphatase [Candidatus Neomarinimicrobiota bacterium]